MYKKVVDLTHVFNGDVLPWPGMAGPKMEKVGSVKAGDACEATVFTMSSHVGTHMDCQIHMMPYGYSTDTIDMGFFIGNGKVIDVRDKVHEVNGELELGMDCLDGVDLSDVDFLFFYLGWDKKWNTPEFYVGYPNINAELAEYLSKHPVVRGIGFETPGVDPVPRAGFDVHKIYLHEKKTIVENLTNLDQLIGKEFTYIGLPLKLENGDGSPIRAVAVLKDED